MTTITTSRPVFSDAETRDGVVASSYLTRRLFDWLIFTHDNDVRYTPEGVGYMPIGTEGIAAFPQRSGYRFRVPPSLSWSVRVHVEAYIKNNHASNSYRLHVTNAVTGEYVDSAASIAPGAEGWLSVEIPMNYAGGTLEVDTTPSNLRTIVNANVRDAQLWFSAWWAPCDGVRSDVTLDTTWNPISQTWATAGRSFHAYALRWLMRKANQFVNWRPQMIAHGWGVSIPGFWPDSGANVTAQIAAGATATHARFKIYEAALCTSIAFHMYGWSRSTTGWSYRILRDGIDIYGYQAFGNVAGSGAWSTLYIPTGNAVPGVHEYAIEVKNGSGATDFGTVASVCAFENLSTIALAPGDVLPSSFPALRRDLITSRSAIRADLDAAGNQVGLASMVRAMHWIWKNRMGRCVVFNNQFEASGSASPSVKLDGATLSLKGRYRFALSPDASESERRFLLRPRIAPAYPSGLYQNSAPIDPLRALVTGIGAGRTGVALFPVANDFESPTEVDGKGFLFSDAAAGYMSVDVDAASSNESGAQRTILRSLVIEEKPRDAVGNLFP